MTRRAWILAAAALAAFGCAKTEKTAAPAPRGKVSAEIADQGPRLVGTPPTVQIELPPRMTMALAEDDTSFATLSPFDFVKDVSPGSNVDGAWKYPHDDRQAPFALVADFDGDGKDDVALLQRSREAGRVVVVFDRADHPRVETVRTWSRMTAGDTGKSGFYLTRFPAGPYHVPDFGGSGDTSKVVTLAHEGIEVSNYGKTATTYWWTGEKFDSVTTGD
jgi:hypothetical protein